MTSRLSPVMSVEEDELAPMMEEKVREVEPLKMDVEAVEEDDELAPMMEEKVRVVEPLEMDVEVLDKRRAARNNRGSSSCCCGKWPCCRCNCPRRHRATTERPPIPRR